MEKFEFAELARRQAESGKLYLEFLRVPDLNCGLYVLPAGGPDPQQPHREDEVYYVISGRGRFSAEGRNEDVGPGTVLYVAKEIEHRFHDITEDLTILVFFASSPHP
jgi:mannose-6-phosphate isomerase-like protein (cupin superfamily)